MSYLRTSMIGIVSGAVGGAVWALGARIAMRLVALDLERPVHFSIEGTLIIMVTGLFFGIPLGLLLTAIRRYLPRSPLPGGLIGGLLVLLIVGYPFYVGPIRSEGGPTLSWLLVALFGGLFLLFGVVVALVNAGLERRVPPLGAGRARKLSIAAVALVSSFELYMFGVMLVNQLQ